jgi:hypothetical protein
MWYTILALVCLVLIILWNPVFEHMTNADLQKKQEFHASKPTNWKMPNPEDTKQKLKPVAGKTLAANPTGNQIYGPKVPEKDPNQPEPNADKNTTGDSMTYPDIYGPEVLTASGTMKKKGDSSSKTKLSEAISTSLPAYDFVPASEFPAGPSEPAPFLNDFSKILKM